MSEHEMAGIFLKECPAGHPAMLEYDDDHVSWKVFCDSIDCCWKYEGNMLTKQEAIDGWNTREGEANE